MTITLRSLHTVVPDTVLVQDEIRDAFLAQPGLDRLARRILTTSFDESGIATRRTVIDDFGAERRADSSLFMDPASGELLLPGTKPRNELYERESSKLFIEAGRRALDGAEGIEAADVTHLITVSCTGCFAPGPDFVVAQALSLPAGVQRYHLGFIGCHASMPALRAAVQFCEADERAVVLIVSVELCTLHLRPSGVPETIVAASLFADGAAAGIVSSRAPGAGEACFALDAAATALAEAGASEMTWTIGDHGFEMTLSPRVPQLIGSTISEALEPLFRGDAGLLDAFESGSVGQAVRHWAIHPGGRAILDRVQSRLELDDEQLAPARETLRDYGNMSSATILFVLKRILEDAALQDGQRVAAIGFGPGLTIDSALLTVVRG